MERIGGKETVKVEARVIALTNVDMATAVKEGRFREELYYRLDMVKIWVPPLRERLADILPLAELFSDHDAREAWETEIKAERKCQTPVAGPQMARECEGVADSCGARSDCRQGRTTGGGGLPRRGADKFE